MFLYVIMADLIEKLVVLSKFYKLCSLREFFSLSVSFLMKYQTKEQFKQVCHNRSEKEDVTLSVLIDLKRSYKLFTDWPGKIQ